MLEQQSHASCFEDKYGIKQNASTYILCISAAVNNGLTHSAYPSLETVGYRCICELHWIMGDLQPQCHLKLQYHYSACLYCISLTSQIDNAYRDCSFFACKSLLWMHWRGFLWSINILICQTKSKIITKCDFLKERNHSNFKRLIPYLSIVLAFLDSYSLPTCVWN